MESAPLAARVRPQKLDELRGQDAIFGANSVLRRLVEKDAFHSLIFWGPAGSGKTSLASIIAGHLKRPVYVLSAVSAGVKDIREVIERSRERIQNHQSSALLFLDEIHRLNKSQQDVLLPVIEDGTIKLIGATTENPSFEVNHAILSRSLVFSFQKISKKAMQEIFIQALMRVHAKVQISPEVMEILAANADGDARKGLNLLEALLQASGEKTEITLSDLAEFKLALGLRYDKNADQHYDLVSAMIKSIRASHPDAALYYMARMLEGGEDPKFIARRLLIAASEDIGNANPHGLLVANAGFEAVQKLGMPEARIVLSQVCTFLASSVKSNAAYTAIDQALSAVARTKDLPVPLHLRNAPTRLMQDLGYAKGYIYPHDEPEKARRQPYLPQELKGVRFYLPKEAGFEKTLRDSLAERRPLVD